MTIQQHPSRRESRAQHRRARPTTGAVPPYGYSEVPAPRWAFASRHSGSRRILDARSGTIDRHPPGPRAFPPAVPASACSRGRRSDGRAPGTGPGALFAFKIWAIRVFCNSRYLSRFAAFVFDGGPEVSIAAGRKGSYSLVADRRPRGLRNAFRRWAGGDVDESPRPRSLARFASLLGTGSRSSVPVRRFHPSASADGP